MKRIYDLCAKYQNYLLGTAIFLSLSAVSVTVSGGSVRMNLGDKPGLILLLMAISLLMVFIYIKVDKNRIEGMSKKISTLSAGQGESQENLLSNLTDRQLKVYELILSGMSNKEIMAELFVEQSTLKSHINQIYKKLKVSSRRELKSKAGKLT